jgi:SEC-C motif domain protein
MKPKLCCCCSKKSFSDCCKPFLKKEAFPETAEQLMRSRYSAFYFGHVNYLNETMCSDADPLAEAPQLKWSRLEIVSTEKGSEFDTEGIVHFKAYYMLKNEEQCLEEQSFFKRIKGRWICMLDSTVY